MPLSCILRTHTRCTHATQRLRPCAQVQRLLKYPLLLRELLGALPDDHPHRAKLTAAAKEITQVT